MAKIKSFTDLNQSRKLAEILPLESADMFIIFAGDREIIRINDDIKNYNHWDTAHVWSLAALLGVLPNNEHITTTLSRGGWKIEPVEYIDKWFCEYEDEVDEDSPCKAFTVSADNPVDACVAMVEKLHELNLLRLWNRKG